jgi:hypothetical protein
MIPTADLVTLKMTPVLLLYKKESRGIPCHQRKALLPVVKFMRHALVNGTICFNIYIVSNFVSDHVGGQLQWPMFTKLAGEHVASSGTITMRVRHSNYKK